MIVLKNRCKDSGIIGIFAKKRIKSYLCAIFFTFLWMCEIEYDT